MMTSNETISRQNYMHQKQHKPTIIKTQVPVPSGLGSNQATIQIPLYLKGTLGFMGGQFSDPYARESRAKYKEKKQQRRDYLQTIDNHQMEDLITQLKKQRIETFTERKKKKKVVVEPTIQELYEKGLAEDRGIMITRAQHPEDIAYNMNQIH